MLKKILIFLLVVLIIIQFFHPARNKHEVKQTGVITEQYAVPPAVKTIIDKACADCHSNNTRYPWYSHIQPVDWWMTDHVNDGKDELNFDSFATYRPDRQYHKLEEIGKTVKEGEMPLNSYLWIHKDAILSEKEKSTLISWAESIQKEMKEKYPADSLVRKKI